MHEIELTREEQDLLQADASETPGNRRDLPDVSRLPADELAAPAALDVRRQLEVIEAFHQDVAERFADALSRALQRLVEVQLTDVQAMIYSQFAFGRPRPTCYFVLQAAPLAAPLALDLSPRLLYPLLDALLGGGKHSCALPERAPSELEQRLSRRVVGMILDELHDAWEPLLAVNLSIDRIESDAQRVRVVAPGDDVVILTFEVRLTEQSGTFSLCLPQRTIRKMVDKLLVGEFTGAEGAALRAARGGESVELTAHFEAEPISQIELDNLRTGDVLLSEVDADGWVQISLDGRRTCQGRPGALNGRRAIVIGPSPTPGRTNG